MKKALRIALHWLPILIILGLGAYLRLYMIRNYMTFLGDEGRDVLIVKRIIVDHKFTLLGPTASVGGFFLGPIYYYFMVPFLWLWKLDPVGPAVMVALFGVATIYLVYKVGKDCFNTATGLIAAGIYACSPLVIMYSRSSWNPNVVPFFSVLLIYLLWKLVMRRQFMDAFWIGAVLGIGIQLHYLFLFLFVLVGVWYIIHIKSIRIWTTLGMTAFGFVVGVSPFLAFELRHNFTNTQSIIQFLMAGKETGFSWAKYIPTITDVIFRIYGRLIFRLPDLAVWSNYPVWYITILLVLTKASIYISLALTFLTVIYSTQPLKKIIDRYIGADKLRSILGVPQHSATGILLLFLWFLVVVLLFGLYRKAIYDYYFGIVFCLPFLLIGYTLSRLYSVKNGRLLAVAASVGLVAFNFQGRPFVFAPNNQLDQVKRIALVALDKTGGKPFNFALLADGNSDHGYRFFFEVSGNTPVTIEPVASDPQRKTVTDQLIVICETIECKPLGHSLWEIAGFGRAEVTGVWEVPFVKIYRLIHYKEIKE